MRRMLWASALFALLTAGLAGCIGDDDDGLPDAAEGFSRYGPNQVMNSQGTLFYEDWAQRAMPFGDGHDHEVSEQHFGLSTPNFQTIGYNPLISDHYGGSAGGYGCSSAIEDGGRTISITNSFTRESAVIVSDVTDRANPEYLGELIMESTHVYDNVLTPDGRYAALSISPFTDGPDFLDGVIPLPGTSLGRSGGVMADGPWPAIFFDNACTGERQQIPLPDAVELLPFASGVLLVDLGDPTDPAVADFWPEPVQGAHSTRAYTFGEETIVVVSHADQATAISYWSFYEIQETALDAKLVLRGIFQPLDHITRSLETAQPRGVHDAYVQVHPITGERIGYFADIDFGAWIVNLDDWAQPVILDHWDQRDVFGRAEFIAHGLRPIDDLWDGRHYTIGHEECTSAPEGLPSCVVWVMDTTDPTDVTTVAGWTIPVEGEWDRVLTYSLHYGELLGRTFLMSNYHGGIWAIDLSDPSTWPEPQTIGVWLPEVESPSPPTGVSNALLENLYGSLFGLSPMVMDLDVMEDGSILAYDLNTGLHVLEFDASQPAPPTKPWPMDFPFDPVAE